MAINDEVQAAKVPTVPTEKKKRSRKLIGAVAIVIIVTAVGIVTGLRNSGAFGYQWEIVDHNEVPGMPVIGHDDYGLPVYGVDETIYATIRHNSGSTDTLTVYCTLTRADLSTVTKTQVVSLGVGQQETLTFYFSNADLKGKSAHSYEIGSK